VLQVAAGAAMTRMAKPRSPQKMGRAYWGFGPVPVERDVHVADAAADGKYGMKADGVGGGGGKRKIRLLAPFYGGCACANGQVFVSFYSAVWGLGCLLAGGESFRVCIVGEGCFVVSRWREFVCFIYYFLFFLKSVLGWFGDLASSSHATFL
jgi:hypothetical protein